MKKIKVDKVILYYMDRVDPDGNLYRFYVYKDMASEIEYFCTEETGNMTIPIGEGEYVKIVPKKIEKIPVRGYRKLTGIWNREKRKELKELCDWYFKDTPTLTMSFSLTEEDFRVTMERDVELSEVARAVKNQHHKKKI